MVNVLESLQALLLCFAGEREEARTE